MYVLYVVLHCIRSELMVIGPKSLNVPIAFSLGALHLEEYAYRGNNGKVTTKQVILDALCSTEAQTKPHRVHFRKQCKTNPR
jgi:hypothetical protein